MHFLFRKKIFFIFSLIVMALSMPVFANSPDALAIRVIKNPNHYSALRWYKEQKFKGAPQSIIVDGYDAVRDGRTVYVNAANISGGALYSNIYLISFNQDAEQGTRDIFGQLLKKWKFNINVGSSGNCVKKDGYLGGYCFSDDECAVDEYCNSEKAAIVRDVNRLASLADIKNLIESYKIKNPENKYPKLDSGTYLKGQALSVWPSWSDTFGKELRASLPKDPINLLGDCGSNNFNPLTCWDEKNRDFAFDISSGFPDCFRVISYTALHDGAGYNLCAVMESGFVWGPGSGACPTVSQPNCQDRDQDGYDNCDNNQIDALDTHDTPDCDDNNKNINPGAIDNTCNGVDENCDGIIDNGFTVNNCSFVCTASGGGSFDTSKTDSFICCGDNNNEKPYEKPEKSCNDGHDNDCDGKVDQDDIVDCPLVCTDDDGDRFIKESITLPSVIGDCGNVCGPFGNASCLGDKDCNDSVLSGYGIHPGAPEICDNIDNNCNGVIDEGFDDDSCQYICSSHGYSWKNFWCCGDDSSEGNRSGANFSGEAVAEIPSVTCNDGLDNDCDGTKDDVLASNPDTDCISCSVALLGAPGAVFREDFYPRTNPGGGADICNQCGARLSDGAGGFIDDDYDGDQGSPMEWNNAFPVPSVPTQADKCDKDCNPLLSATVVFSDYENGIETRCDGKDNNCDGIIDNIVETPTTCGQGKCASNTGTVTCVGGVLGDSCDPFFGAAANDAICDNIDSDCDGAIDEDFVSSPTTCGVGVCVNTGTQSCVAGTLQNSCVPKPKNSNTDTNCDNKDDDCDGAIDEDYGSTPTSCGVGACARSGVSTCIGGAVADTCVPRAPAANDAVCDGLDNDCDGAIDEDFVSSPTTCGVGVCVNTGTQSCVAGTLQNSCVPKPKNSDTDANCDGQDDDCDGAIDEDGFVIYYRDADGDLFGDPTKTTSHCGTTPPPGYVADNTDCNDTPFTGFSIHPGATEICGDSIDNDCDGNNNNGFNQDGDGYLICNGDCNDNDPSVFPGATEYCDGVDSNCSSLDVDTNNDNEPCCGDGICGSTNGTYIYDDLEDCSVCIADCGICTHENDCGLWMANLLPGEPASGVHIQPYTIMGGSVYLAGAGNYSNIQEDIPIIFNAGISGLAIGKNTRVEFFKNDNFTGQVYFDFIASTGPAAIINYFVNPGYKMSPYSVSECFGLNTSVWKYCGESWNNPTANMAFWRNGSLRITCN